MARIPEVEIERLKSGVSLVRLVEGLGREAGRSAAADQVGALPLPRGRPRRRALSVTPAKNLFHCFGCGAAGGPIDWVMKRQGVSFRHAIELLRDGSRCGPSQPGRPAPVKTTTVRRLSAAGEAWTPTIRRCCSSNQVVGYYHETLKHSPEALAYLQARGLVHGELIERFRLGYADRTLGLRLPEKTRKAGAEVRARLEAIGLYRASGHEHFTGSLVVPVMDERGDVKEVYGRKIGSSLRAGTPLHLYLPGPHRGVWNVEGIAASRGEVILAEALIDAMTFWCARLPERHCRLWRERLHRRPPGRLPALRRQARADRLRPRRRRRSKAAAELAAAADRRGPGGPTRIEVPQGHGRQRLCAEGEAREDKSLGVLIRKAMWLGQGKAPQGASGRPHQRAGRRTGGGAGRSWDLPLSN